MLNSTEKIFDCILISNDPENCKVLETYCEKTPLLKLVNTLYEPQKVFDVLAEMSIDLIFLDCKMPLSFRNEFLKQIPNQIQVVTLVEESDFSFDTKEINNFIFLLKPITYTLFLKAVLLVMQHYNDSVIEYNNQKKFIFVRHDSQLTKIMFEEIRYVEAKGDYIHIYCENSNYIVLSALTKFLNKLPKSIFIKTHRSFVVNINKINQIDNCMLKIGDSILPIGRKYKELLLSTLNVL